VRYSGFVTSPEDEEPGVYFANLHSCRRRRTIFVGEISTFAINCWRIMPDASAALFAGPEQKEPAPSLSLSPFSGSLFCLLFRCTPFSADVHLPLRGGGLGRRHTPAERFHAEICGFIGNSYEEAPRTSSRAEIGSSSYRSLVVAQTAAIQRRVAGRSWARIINRRGPQ